jgi:hypothetical protein
MGTWLPGFIRRCDDILRSLRQTPMEVPVTGPVPDADAVLAERLRDCGVAELSERFWSRVDKTPTCWNWRGRLNSYGYGTFYADDSRRKAERKVMAHRVMYRHLVGPIPPGLTIDHLCRNHRCVNPAHLEVVTARENILRGSGPSARAAKATHCPKGHPYDRENTALRNHGRHRVCRICERERHEADPRIGHHRRGT